MIPMRLRASYNMGTFTPAIEVASQHRLRSANRHRLIVPRCRLNTYVLLCVWNVQHKSWGFDFRRNGKLEPTTYGQYSTELFTSEAESIIANHDTSKVGLHLWLLVNGGADHSIFIHPFVHSYLFEMQLTDSNCIQGRPTIVRAHYSKGPL